MIVLFCGKGILQMTLKSVSAAPCNASSESGEGANSFLLAGFGKSCILPCVACVALKI